VRGATNVCNFASQVEAGHILFTSTMMVYGPTEVPKGEDAKLEPVNAYGPQRSWPRSCWLCPSRVAAMRLNHASGPHLGGRWPARLVAHGSSSGSAIA
jgi:hypothetical protein